MTLIPNSAKESDVLLLNEIGLDPGIDHCSAVELCEDVRKMGRQPVSFISVCGGLPVPEDSNVPLGYKFSWSPRGVLTAALNGAKYRLNSRVRNLPQTTFVHLMCFCRITKYNRDTCSRRS